MGACPSGRAAVQCPSWAYEKEKTEIEISVIAVKSFIINNKFIEDTVFGFEKLIPDKELY
jgi:hypothetical protein